MNNINNNIKAVEIETYSNEEIEKFKKLGLIGYYKKEGLIGCYNGTPIKQNQ